MVFLLTVAIVAPEQARAAMTIDAGPKYATRAGQITVWWFSSSTGSSEMRWDTTADSWDDMDNDVSNTATNLGTMHSRTISNLAAGTYYVRVRTTGAAGTGTSAAKKIVLTDSIGSNPLNRVVVLDGNVMSVAESTDGSRAYLGGNFTQIGRRTGSAGVVNSAGTVGNGLPVFQGPAWKTISDGAGGFYVAGGFTAVGATDIRYLAHVLPDGGVDPTFDPDLDYTVRALALSGSTLFVSGDFATIGDDARPGLGAIDIPTQRATSWNPAPDAYPRALLVDGTNLYLGGDFTVMGGAPRNRLAKYNTATGVLDPSWNPNADGSVEALAINTATSTLYVGGSFTTLQGSTPRNRLAAVSTAAVGAPTTWNPNVGGTVWSLALDTATSTLFAGGNFATVNGATARNLVAALDTSVAAGTARAWAPVLVGTDVSSLTLSGSNLYVTGAFSNVAGTPRGNGAVVDKGTGALGAWNPSTEGTIESLAISSGTIQIAGTLNAMNVVTRNRAAAVDLVNGAILAFDPNITGGDVRSVVATAASVYYGGAFTTVGGTGRSFIAKVNPTSGVLDTTWVPAPSATVYAMATDGTDLYYGGSFTTVNGTAHRCLAKSPLTGTGAPVALGTWAAQAENTVFAMDVVGSNLVVGGAFTWLQSAGNVRNRAGAVALSNGAVQAWDPNVGAVATERVWAIESDGATVWLGGSFTAVNGATPRSGLAAFPVGTSTATAWDPGPNAMVRGLAYSDGVVYAGGDFTSIAGVTRNYAAGLDPTVNTNMATSWNPNFDNPVQTMSAGAEYVYAGGIFTSVRGWYYYGNRFAVFAPSNRNNFGDAAGVSIVGTPDANVKNGQLTVDWTTTVSGTSELVWDRVSRGSWDDYRYDLSNTATNLGTLHSRTISNLPVGTVYYRVRTRTAAGQQVTTAQRAIVITTGNERDMPLGSVVVGGDVYDTQTSSDGATTYVGGRFATAGERRGAGLQIATATGAARTAGIAQVNGTVWASVSDGAGGYYIAGRFRRVGAMAHDNLAHILPDGGVDPNFNFDFDANVYSLARSGTTLYVGGAFSTVNSTSKSLIAAINTSTKSLIGGFAGTGVGSSVRTLLVNGSTLYVGGSFSSMGGGAHTNLAAVSTTTGAQTAWTSNTDGTVYALAADGTHLYVGGNFATVATVARSKLAKVLLSTGATDSGFNPNATGTGGGSTTYVYSLALNGSTIYAGGSFANIGGNARTNVAALSTTTGASTSWAPNPWLPVRELQYASNRLYVGGEFLSVSGGTSRSGFAAFDTTTMTLIALNPMVGGEVWTIAVDGASLYVGGAFATIGGTLRANILAVDTASGELTGFNPGTNDSVLDLELTGTTLYVGGHFTRMYGATVRNRLASIDVSTTAGSLTAFDPNMSSAVRAMALNGTVLYAGGDFTTVNGSTARNRLAAITIATSVATAWNPGADATVEALLLNGGNLYVGGDFTTISSTARNFLAAYTTGTPATPTFTSSWNANAAGSGGGVYTLAASGTLLYVGGWFTNMGGQARNHIAALTASTAVATTWNPDANDSVRRIHVAGGNVYAGGDFDFIGGVYRWFLAELDPAAPAGTATSWIPNPGATVYAISSVGTDLYVGGSFVDTKSYNYSQSGLVHYDLCVRTTACTGAALREYTTISLDSANVSLGSGYLGSLTATSTVTVMSNAASGYTLKVSDDSDTWGLACTVGACAGSTIPDWTGDDDAPTTWAPADTGTEYGFGVTLLSTTAGIKDRRWGTGTTATDFVNNRYAGMTDSYFTDLHASGRYSGSMSPDTNVIGYRVRAAPGTIAGNYEAELSIVAVPTP